MRRFAHDAARRWWRRDARRHQPGAAADADWPANVVDRFILARLEEENLQPSPEADRLTLLRHPLDVPAQLLVRRALQGKLRGAGDGGEQAGGQVVALAVRGGDAGAVPVGGGQPGLLLLAGGRRLDEGHAATPPVMRSAASRPGIAG